MNKSRFETYTSSKTHVDGIMVKDAYRKFIFDRGNDELFFPAIATSDIWCAAFDGVEIVMVGGHPYLPCSWLKKEFPNFDYRTLETAARASIEA